MTYVCVTFVILISSVHWLFVTVQSANVKWSHEFPCTLPRCSGHITWCVFTLSGGTAFPSRGLTLAYLPTAQCAASAKNTVQTVTLHGKGKLGALLRFSAFRPPLMFSRVFVHVSKYLKSTLWRQTQSLKSHTCFLSLRLLTAEDNWPHYKNKLNPECSETPNSSSHGVSCPLSLSPFLDTHFHKGSQLDLIENAGEVHGEGERAGDQSGRCHCDCHQHTHVQIRDHVHKP